jgi:hypothetical protein
LFTAAWEMRVTNLHNIRYTFCAGWR